MSVYKLDNGRWRVQVRRKGFPNCEGVSVTQRDPKAHEATFVAECEAAAARGRARELPQWREPAWP